MMPESPAVPDVPPAVAKRAVAWILEMQSSDEPDKTAAELEDWCDRHPDHQRAWQHIEQLNQRFGLLTEPGRAAVAQHALDAAGISRRQVLKALSALLVVGATGYGANESGLLNHWRADYRTVTGEQRRLTLADGTEITLNSGSAIRVRNSGIEQRIHLLEGEIYVATGPRYSVPLFVEVEQGIVQAMGTRFALRQLGKQCRLAVYQGQVELRPRRSAGSCLLNPGDSTLFTQTGWAPLRSVKPDETAWTQGVIVVRAMPLGQFVEELGRYRPGILRVDPRVAKLTVSGTYPVTETDTVLQSLTGALPIQLRSVTRYWVTLAPA